MEDELWVKLYQMVRQLGKNRRPPKAQFTDAQIALTYLWAVLHDRPICWASQRRSWPIYWRRMHLPSPSTMTRRLRTPGVEELLQRVEGTLIHHELPSLPRWIDAKPMPIGGNTQDAQAGYGRAASCMAKGYKLYAIADWRQGFIARRAKPC